MEVNATVKHSLTQMELFLLPLSKIILVYPSIKYCHANPTCPTKDRTSSEEVVAPSTARMAPLGWYFLRPTSFILTCPASPFSRAQLVPRVAVPLVASCRSLNGKWENTIKLGLLLVTILIPKQLLRHNRTDHTPMVTLQPTKTT